MLLAIVLYNTFGYYMVFAYAQGQARFKAIQNIPDSALQVVKMNLAIYNSLENTDFEYIDKEIFVEGKMYHVVKKRIVDDTLQLYYLRNTKQEALIKNFNAIVETQMLSKQSPDQETPLKLFAKNSSEDYLPTSFDLVLDCRVHGKPLPTTTTWAIEQMPLSPCLALFSPPPELG